MKDSESDDVVLLKASSDLFASKPSVRTLERWSDTGFIPRGCSNKKPIILRTFSEGSAIYTRVAWIEKFKSDCTARRKARKR